MSIVIVAPHPDDEIIGCFEVIRKLAELNKVTNVHYLERGKDPIPPYINPVKDLSQWIRNENAILYFPDPIYETHPLHRKAGAWGERILREGFNVIFYSVNMQAPYIHEVVNPEQKRTWLNQAYKAKSSLWATDHRYFLFEGYTKWMMKGYPNG